MARNPSTRDHVGEVIRSDEEMRQQRVIPTGAESGSGEQPHTFVFQGPLTIVNGVSITPHKETIASGSTATIIALSKTGPASGTCDVYWYVNATNIDDTDLPYTLADGDLISPFLDASDDAESVSAHFTILRA